MYVGPFYFSATSLKVEGDENWIEGQRSQGEVRGVMKEDDDQGRARGQRRQCQSECRRVRSRHVEFTRSRTTY